MTEVKELEVPLLHYLQECWLRLLLLSLESGLSMSAWAAVSSAKAEQERWQRSVRLGGKIRDVFLDTPQ